MATLIKVLAELVQSELTKITFMRTHSGIDPDFELVKLNSSLLVISH